MSLNHQALGSCSDSEKQLNRLFIFVILSGFAIALTPFFMLLYDARGSLLTKWDSLQTEINQWAITGLTSAQSQIRDGATGLASFRSIPQREMVALPLNRVREQGQIGRSKVSVKGLQGDRVTIEPMTAIAPEKRVVVPITVATEESTPKTSQAMGTEEDLRQFLTQGQFHRTEIALPAFDTFLKKEGKVVKVASKEVTSSPRGKSRKLQQFIQMVEVSQALPKSEVSTKELVSSLSLVSSPGLEGTGDGVGKAVKKTVKVEKVELGSSPVLGEEDGQKVSQRAADLMATDSDSLSQYLTDGRFHRQLVTQTPKKEDFLIADTRLAPFTVSVNPEDSEAIAAAPFQIPVETPTNSEIAKNPLVQQQFLIADTRLAPFTVSVNPEDSEAIASTSFQVPVQTSSTNNNPTVSVPSASSTQSAVPDTDLSSLGVPPNAIGSQSSGILQPLPSIPLAPLPSNRLISQGGSTERNLTPTTPTPNLQQEKEPDPTGEKPNSFVPLQEATPESTPKKDLFTPYSDPTLTEQEFTNTQLFDVFQEINLSNYYDTTIAPLQQAIQQQQAQQPVPEGTIPQQIDQLMEKALSGTALRYPWILNSSDNLSFAPMLFRPKDNQFYFNIDLNFVEPNPTVNQITFGGFPYKDQFYWLLDQNKVVIETFGGQGGIVYQGKEKDIQIQQTLILGQTLLGYQAVWVIPYDLQRLFKPEELAKFTIISIAGQLTNPDGTSAGPVVIDSSSITGNSANVVYLPDPNPNPDRIGIASTFNPNGGGAMFGNLAVKNAPLILQAFPTTDIRPLYGIDFVRGAIVPKDKLEAAGIFFGDVFKGEPARFTAPITSVPGIKTAQPDTFDNKDLLALLTNPYLSQPERDYNYLNSIQWLATGTRQPEVVTRTLGQSEKDWYRLFFSAPHNRVMLQYSADQVEATYLNLYSSPGISFTFPYDGGELDGPQTLNSSLGMVMGWIFDAFNLEDLDESLDKAKEERKQEKFFAALNTKMSSQDRKLINQRLNTNLAYANLGSSLNQVSGFITFPSVITPKESSVFQIKTGNIQRAVQFLGSDVGDWQEGSITIADIRLDDIGPLNFLGSTLPVAPSYTLNGVRQTGVESNPAFSNSSSASQVILISPEGRQYIQNFNPYNLTEIPTTIRNYSIAFDRIFLERRDTRIIDNHYFNGYLYLPTIELVYAGTSEDFNYTFNVGSWFNVNSTSAPGVRYNNLGLQEPTVGFYTNIVLSANSNSFDLDENNQVEAVSSHAPLLRFNWNSANNSNNPWQVSLNYTYSRQTRDFGLSLTGGVGYIPQYGNGPFIGLLYGKLGLPMGLSANCNVELGEQIYYNVGILQRVWENFSIGPYVTNYTDINQGFNSRKLLLNYGGLVQHQFPDSPVTMTAQIGTSEEGTIASIKGGIRF